jgi:hypothetical protein
MFRLHLDDRISERALLSACVEEAVVIFGSGVFDSHTIALTAYLRRVKQGNLEADKIQTKDYIQYLFRELPAHVCRHADGHFYHFHKETECGTVCDAKYQQSQKQQRREPCTTCFLELTTAGRCPIGCDD